MSDDTHTSRDFPTDLTDFEVANGFVKLAAYRLGDTHPKAPWTFAVGKIVSPNQVVFKLRFRGEVRYNLFRYGCQWFDKKLSKPGWEAVGGQSSGSFDAMACVQGILAELDDGFQSVDGGFRES